VIEEEYTQEDDRFAHTEDADEEYPQEIVFEYLTAMKQEVLLCKRAIKANLMNGSSVHQLLAGCISEMRGKTLNEIEPLMKEFGEMAWSSNLSCSRLFLTICILACKNVNYHCLMRAHTVVQ
jgi:hypothetical protein